jgi:hypothetical protein
MSIVKRNPTATIESEFSKKNGEENNSDRFSYDSQQKVRIPASIVKVVAKLRRFGCLPPSPKVIIINQHREFCSNLKQLSTNEDLKALIKLLQKSLVLKDGEKMAMEDSKNRLMLDFYLQYPNVDIPFTCRSRLSQSDNKIDSHRVICVNARAKTERLRSRQRKGRHLLVRKEEILIARDNNKMVLPSLQSFLERVDKGKRNQPKAEITDIVLKKIYRFNAGEKTLWNHCEAFYLDRKTNQKINSTKRYGLVGMSPYLLFCLQEVWQYHLTVAGDRILTPRTYKKKIYPLVEKGRDLRDIFDSFKDFSERKSHFFILEVESRGRKNLEQMFPVVESVEKITPLQPRLERKVALIADRNRKA